MHWLNGETLERFEHCSVVTWDFPVGSNDEESACNMGDLGLIPQSPGEENGNSFQCSCLENSRDWGAWWATFLGVTKSRTDWATNTVITLLQRTGHDWATELKANKSHIPFQIHASPTFHYDEKLQHGIWRRMLLYLEGELEKLCWLS